MIIVNPKICKSCKYHIGFGAQPGRLQTGSGENRNVACNYLTITGHSRIFENGELKYDPKYCDKYCPGARITDCNIELHNVEYDEYDQYKADRVGREKSGQP